MNTNRLSVETLNDTSSIVLVETPPPKESSPSTFDNDYQDLKESDDNTTDEFHPGPHFEASWKLIDEETVNVTFSLFSLSKTTEEKKRFEKNHDTKKKLDTNFISVPRRSMRSIDSLKYFLFTVRQYKTNTEIVRDMQELIPKHPLLEKEPLYSNSFIAIRLNPKEKYAICIYYYQKNSTKQLPDLLICIDIIHDHSKHSDHGLLFVLTQYSIIFGILIVLQGLFSMRKRRLAHIIHQHIRNKTQRIRSSLSSVSLVRQSFSSANIITESEHPCLSNHEVTNLQKRIISSPAIILTAPSTSSSKTSLNHYDEHEPFIKSISHNKNHVHFFCSLDEGSDDNDSNDSIFIPEVSSTHQEPYSDRSDALLYMTHILDTNKPWSKHTIPVEE